MLQKGFLIALIYHSPLHTGTWNAVPTVLHFEADAPLDLNRVGNTKGLEQPYALRLRYVLEDRTQDSLNCSGIKLSLIINC